MHESPRSPYGDDPQLDEGQRAFDAYDPNDPDDDWSENRDLYEDDSAEEELEEGRRRRLALVVGALLGVLMLVAAGVFIVLSGDNDPTAVATPSPTPLPSNSPSTSPLPPADTPSPGATITPSPNPPLPPAACAASGSEQAQPFGTTAPIRILNESYASEEQAVPAFAVDRDGCAHVVLARPGAARLNYLTNRSGEWTEQVLPSPGNLCTRADIDRVDALAADDDGSIWVAITRVCAGRRQSVEGAFYVTNASGIWADPVRLSDSGTRGLSLKVRAGVLHFAFASDAGLHYRTNRGGNWSNARVSRRTTYEADLQLGSDGLPRILFIDNAIRFAVQPRAGADFDVERVAAYDEAWDPRLALDGRDRPHALWGADWRGSSGISSQYSSRGRSWREPFDPFDEDAEALGMALQPDGTVHFLAGIEDGGVMHVNNLSGAFEEQLLFPAWDASYDKGSLAIDARGRLQAVFFAGHAEHGGGLWFAYGQPVLARLMNPLDINLVIDATGTIDGEGVVALSGSISCSRAFSQLQLSLSLEQGSTDDYAYAWTSVALDNCGPGPTVWQAQLGGLSRDTTFVAGRADATASVEVCESALGIGYCHFMVSDTTVTLTSTAPPPATPTAPPPFEPSPTPETVAPLPMPKPELAFVGRREVGSGAELLIFYDLTVANWQAYQTALFAPAPGLPECGPGVSAARTWVEVRDAANDSMVYAHCFMYDPAELADELSIARRPTDPVPAFVYLELVDRLTGRSVRSDLVALPPPEGE